MSSEQLKHAILEVRTECIEAASTTFKVSASSLETLNQQVSRALDRLVGAWEGPARQAAQAAVEQAKVATADVAALSSSAKGDTEHHGAELKNVQNQVRGIQIVDTSLMGYVNRITSGSAVGAVKGASYGTIGAMAGGANGAFDAWRMDAKQKKLLVQKAREMDNTGMSMGEKVKGKGWLRPTRREDQAQRDLPGFEGVPVGAVAPIGGRSGLSGRRAAVGSVGGSRGPSVTRPGGGKHGAPSPIPGAVGLVPGAATQSAVTGATGGAVHGVPVGDRPPVVSPSGGGGVGLLGSAGWSQAGGVGSGGSVRGFVDGGGAGSPRSGAVPGPVGGNGGSGGSSSTGSGSSTTGGSSSGPGGRGAMMGPAGFGPGATPANREDNELAERPEWLVETEDIWGDGRKVAPPVIG